MVSQLTFPIFILRALELSWFCLLFPIIKVGGRSRNGLQGLLPSFPEISFVNEDLSVDILAWDLASFFFRFLGCFILYAGLTYQAIEKRRSLIFQKQTFHASGLGPFLSVVYLYFHQYSLSQRLNLKRSVVSSSLF